MGGPREVVQVVVLSLFSIDQYSSHILPVQARTDKLYTRVSIRPELSQSKGHASLPNIDSGRL
jgi:hypothetical protein